MSSSLTLTCAFCGLRFANSPLLELHIRDDHLQREQHAEPDRGAAVRTQVPQPRADGSSRMQSQASKPRRTTKEVTIMKAAPRRAMTALRAVIRTLRHFNAKLLLAAEAMLRPIGASRSRPRVDKPAGPSGAQAPPPDVRNAG
jgi:hypothetical protein